MCLPLIAGVAGPLTIGGVGVGTIATGAAAAGTLVQGLSGVSQQKTNARVAEVRGRNALRQAIEQESRIRTRNERTLSTLRLQDIASGFAINQGSKLEVAKDDAAQLELDALTARFAGTAENINQQNVARASRSQARLGLAATLLTTGATAAKGFGS